MTKTLQVILICLFLFFVKPLMASQSQNDATCLAQAIFFESGNESLSGQYAVGAVIMNRVHAGISNSVCGVIHQHSGNHWQFGFNKFRKSSIPRNRQKYFYSVATTVMSQQAMVLPANVLYFNNHLFDKTRYALYVKIGHQYFFSKRKG